MFFDDDIAVPIGVGKSLPGHCRVPDGAHGLVVFVHGSGSSRRSPRNQMVADHLNEHGLGTLLFDLLTADEGERRRNIFDIDLLVDRVGNARAWLHMHPRLSTLKVGLFGASTGAAAALVSAASNPEGARAVVSRGGRVDLAGRWLTKVRAPSLLIVGGDDDQVLIWNRESARRLTCENRIEVVAGASHLFEEPGALEEVARLASSWFTTHLDSPLTVD